MPDAIRIRPETVADAAAVFALIAAAFGQEDEARLVDRLRADGDAAIALVAEEDGAVVGHVLLSPLAAPFPALGLAPVSVAPDRQRHGIGAALVRAALAAATTAGDWRAVFVLGDPAYYGRFGFSAAAATNFASPFAGPHFMACPLGETMPDLRGPVRYAPAFAAL